MSCRDTQHLLDLAHDGALPETKRAELAQHLASCPDCRRYQAQLAHVQTAVRTAATAIELPDVNEEIRRVQARLVAPTSRRKRRVLAPVLWLGAPLAAAAALAVVFFNGSQTAPSNSPIGESQTQVDYVVPGDPAASTMVYVDQDSGWLVVWASTPPLNHNS